MKIFKKICVAGLACLLLCFGVATIGCGEPPLTNNEENVPSVPTNPEKPSTGNDNKGEEEKPPVEEEKPPIEEEDKVDFTQVLANLKTYLVEDSGLLDTDLVSNIDDVLDVKVENNILTASIATQYLFSDDESMFDFSEDGFHVEVKNQNDAIVFTITKI